MRQIVLDTETTGIDPGLGHRVIEIGGVEVVNRRLTGRHFHAYLKPDREVDAGALAVHGITDAFLADKPRFDAVVDAFLAFVDGAELVIHNAPFDVGFLNAELARLDRPDISAHCTVLDTLALARRMYPGQRNSLDALCKRLDVDNSGRELHGALLDSEILADVYLLMTGGQTALDLASEVAGTHGAVQVRVETAGLNAIPRASDVERTAHAAYLEMIERESGGPARWHALMP
ncbi:MAG: DNA polymerase III subunit epsilon [Pseudomonadota bacterium]